MAVAHLVQLTIPELVVLPELDITDRALLAGGVCFVRTHPVTSCAAYWLLIQPNLWGGVDLVRQWGRRDVRQRRPRRKVGSYRSLDALERRLRAQVGRRLHRGYVVRGVALKS